MDCSVFLPKTRLVARRERPPSQRISPLPGCAGSADKLERDCSDPRGAARIEVLGRAAVDEAGLDLADADVEGKLVGGVYQDDGATVAFAADMAGPGMAGAAGRDAAGR